MNTQEIIALISIAIGVWSYAHYGIAIYQGKTRPHVFSWFVWGLLTGIAWAAQFHEKAGPGAWVTGSTALVCFAIAFVSLRVGEKNITRSDWWTFCAALAAIPLWYFTNNPLWAVLLITAIDALAFYPTFRKSWLKPGEEAILAYGLSALKFGFSLLALENFTFTTSFYPASLVVMNGVFVVMVLIKRKAIAQTDHTP